MLAFILPAALVYLSGLIIKKHKGGTRAGALLSTLWIFAALVVTEPYGRYGRYGDITEFLLAGILPVIIYWGVLWVVNGFINEKTES